MLICDLQQEFLQELKTSPALVRAWDACTQPQGILGLPERYQPMVAQITKFGPIALLRPDSGQIEGEPTGWNFGTESEPRWKYRFEDWPSEYKEYWKQRPITPQADFLNSTAKITAIIGGNGVAKTTSLLAVMIAACHGLRPWLSPDDPDHLFRYPDGRWMEPPIQFAYFTDDFAKILKVVYRQKLFPPGGWQPSGSRRPHPRIESVKINQEQLCMGGHWDKATKKSSTGMPSILSFANGSEVPFYSYSQDIEAWEGTESHAVGYDEPPIRSAWVAAQRGLRTSGGPTYLALTPISQPWIQSSIIDAAATNKAIKVVVTDSFSNYQNQDPGWVYERWDDLHPTEIRSRIFGRYATTEGAVFKEFDPAEGKGYVLPTRDIPPSWPVVLGIDPHPHKAARCAWLLVRPDDGVEVLSTRLLEALGVKEVVQELEQLEASFAWKNRVVLRIMDPHIAVQAHSLYGKGDTATTLDLFESASPEGWIWDIPEARGPGSIDIGHSLMHQMFKPRYNRLTKAHEPWLQVWEDGDKAGLINALCRYSYKTKKAGSKEDTVATGKLTDDEFKDIVDAIRYPIVYGLSFDELMAIAQQRRGQVMANRVVAHVKTGG